MGGGGSRSVTMRDGTVISFSNTGTELPISRLRLSEGSICADKREFDKSAGRELYKLVDTSEYGGCYTEIGGQTTDSRYTNVGSV